MGRKVILPLCWWRGRATSLGVACTSSWGRWATLATWWFLPSAWRQHLPCSCQGPKAWLSHRLLSLGNYFLWFYPRWRKPCFFLQWSRPWWAIGILVGKESGVEFKRMIWFRCLLPQLRTNENFTLEMANKIYIKKERSPKKK